MTTKNVPGKTCKRCGKPITGYKTFCVDCAKQLQRERSSKWYREHPGRHKKPKIEQSKAATSNDYLAGFAADEREARQSGLSYGQLKARRKGN